MYIPMATKDSLVPRRSNFTWPGNEATLNPIFVHRTLNCNKVSKS